MIGHRLAVVALGLVLVFGTANAGAAPFSTDVTITGEIEFDTGSSYADMASSTGLFGVLGGGVASESQYATSVVISGPNPVSDALTDFGDGLGITGIAFGQYSAAAGDSEFRAGIDLEMTLMNSSATDTYEVILDLSFSNLVHALGTAARMDSEFTLDDDVGEFFFTDLVSDTINGNEIDGVPTGDHGGPVNEAGLLTFSILLAPGDVSGVHGGWTMGGGAFTDPPSMFTGAFGMNLIVTDVVYVTIPEPGTGVLLALGLLAGSASARRRRNRPHRRAPARRA